MEKERGEMLSLQGLRSSIGPRDHLHGTQEIEKHIHTNKHPNTQTSTQTHTPDMCSVGAWGCLTTCSSSRADADTKREDKRTHMPHTHAHAHREKGRERERDTQKFGLQ